ncbi:hypothetical protein H6758_04900 [Candidatus Nomurabacteria bacterium]|nr:hypothetical protein [Candidatus Nomurabacteria bacterium]
MTEEKKRIIFIIGFIIVTLVFGYAIYRVFFAPKEPVPYLDESPDYGVGEFPFAGEGEPQTPVTGPGVLPSTDTISPTQIISEQERLLAEQPTSRIVSEAVVSASVTASGNLNYYNPQNGKFYKVDAEGNIVPLSDEVFFNVQNVTWSPADDQAILEYPDGSKLYYNFATNEQATIPKHWEEFSFSKNGSRIASKSIGLSPENRWLVVANPDGKNVKFVEPLGDNADKVNVDFSPNGQIVGTSMTGASQGADRQEVLFVGQNGENFRSTMVEGRGLVTHWSPTGNKLLYSVYSASSQYKPELWIVNASPQTIGTGRKSLKINTWANKCTFENERFIYCGVPVSLDPGAGLEPSIADAIQDRIYKIDLQTGAQIEIPTPELYTIDSIQFDTKNRRLFFTDKIRSGIFNVQL